MGAKNVVSSFTYLLLFASVGLELISFLTSHMVLNRVATALHDGIFQRCGAMNYFQLVYNRLNNFIQYSLDGAVTPSSGCYWWNSRVFETDEKSMQAVVVFAFMSIGLVLFIILLSLISLIERFRTKALSIFLGVLLMVNAVLISTIIVIYTLLYARDAKMAPGALTPLIFSWSYWMLYAVAFVNLFTAILFCCNSGRY